MDKKRKIVLIVVSILLVLSISLGISYAYYTKSHNQEESNIVKTKCLNFSLTNEKNDINLDEQYPIPDSEGRKLTPYQFTITNTCEQFISYNVNLESLESTTMDSNAVKVMINNEAPVNLGTLESTSVSIDSSKDSKILATGSLGSGDSVDYALRVWMDYGDSADASSMDKVFESKIVVVATVGTYKPSDYVSTLHDAILVNEYGVTDVNNAISKIESKATPDFSQTAPAIEWEQTTGNKISKTVIKPTLNAIKSNETMSDLDENEYKMRVCSDISFDKTSAKYTLSNCSLKDPTTLDYSNNYYYSAEFMSYSSSRNKFYSDYNYKGYEVYRITSATSNTITSSLSDISYEAISYNLTVIPQNGKSVELDKSDRGLYTLDDEYGFSYYYRGNVSNNNVYFAGYYWQIIRINGDNTIRLMYNGMEKNASGLKKMINNYSGIFNDKFDSPAYVGYMYGDTNGTTYSDFHSNKNSSAIKNYVDNWYKQNILDKGFEEYISTGTGFCGDRSLYSGDGISLNVFSNFGIEGRIKNNTFRLTCPNHENDLYTISSSNIGNKALTYPIGLITADELFLAGMSTTKLNKFSWAYSDYDYTTMTPDLFNSVGVYSTLTVLSSSGIMSLKRTTGATGYRPVINLKADVEISGGIGTINDPYIIKTN